MTRESEWMLDVVADLEAFCQANEMKESATALSRVLVVISDELQSEGMCPHLDSNSSGHQPATST